MKAILLAASLPLLAACAATPESAVPADEKRYATGSNIPMRNRDVHIMTPEAFEQVKTQASGNTGRPPGN